eukprot:23837-Chlamydomonas_euryale.AAC.2
MHVSACPKPAARTYAWACTVPSFFFCPLTFSVCPQFFRRPPRAAQPGGAEEASLAARRRRAPLRPPPRR